MSPADRRGFTVAEVMVAVMFLTVGVMALVGSSALTTRMIGQGKESTQAMSVGEWRADYLRQLATSTAAPCTHANFTNGSATTNGVQEQWVIAVDATNNTLRNVKVIVRYNAGRTTRSDTLFTTIRCF